MAGKSLLSRLKKRKKAYKVKQPVPQSQPVTVGDMAGRYRSSSSSGASARGDAPPPKKRKTEEENVEEEEWDDFDVTQADLDDLEIQASQVNRQSVQLSSRDPAYVKAYGIPAERPSRPVEPDPQPSTSRGLGKPQTDTSGRFVRPQLSRQSNSSSSSGSGRSHQLYPGQLPPRNGGSRLLNSSSSSSGSSSTGPRSSTSFDGSRTSSSIHSGSSEEIPFAQRPGSLSRGFSSESNHSIDVTGILGRDHSVNEPNGADINMLRQETSGLKLQVREMKEELDAKEGEIKILRDNLSRQEADLEKLKSEKIGQILQHQKQQSEKEKALQTEINRIKDQFDFSEHEKRVLETRCRDLEGQIKNLQSGPTSSQALPATQTSPVPRQVPVVKRESPKMPSSFPSTATFHAAEGSPRKQAKGDDSIQTTSTAVQTAELVTRSKPVRRHQLRCTTSCKTSGPQLVARLLQITPSSAESLSNRGIAGLLQTPAASVSAESVAFDRDRDTSLLSPCRRRISDVQTLLEAQEKPETSSIVSLKHFNIAVYGLTQMLQPDKCDEDVVEEEPANAMKNLTISDDSSLDHAVAILPLLKDYLAHYLRMLETSTESFEASPSTTSSSSGSFESSVESSLGLFLKDSTTYANNLESLALASVRTLHILTSCRSVRNVLLRGHGMEESDSSGSNTSEKPSTSSAAEGEKHGISLQKEYLEDLNLLQKLIKLADPGAKGRLFNVEVVRTSLSVLTKLAKYADKQQLHSLIPLISEEVLHNCIECEADSSVICCCLELLQSLVKSNTVVSGLCVNASDCVLLCLYRVCTKKSFLTSFSGDTRLQISNKVINLLNGIASLHKGGLTILLESDCLCSVEVVQSVVILLYNVLKLHQEETESVLNIDTVIPKLDEEKPDSLKIDDKMVNLSFSILQKGTLLLHQMFQHELDFIRRHSSVQHQYVLLIQQLTRIFKNAGAEKYNNEISALQDLWDFSPDEEDYDSLHDTSREDEGEMDMS